MIEAIRVTRASIHTIPYGSVQCRGRSRDKRPHVGLRILQDGSKERGGEFGRKGRPSQAMLQRFVGVHPRPEPPLGCHPHMEMGTQRWHPPEPPPAWFLPPMLSRPWKPLPSGFDQALVGSSDVPTGSLLQLYRIHPWFEVSPLGSCSPASWGTAQCLNFT